MVLKFRLKRKPSREQAINWLVQNNIKFPTVLDNEIGPDTFHGWRFVRGLDGIMYFGCGTHPGIIEDEVK